VSEDKIEKVPEPSKPVPVKPHEEKGWTGFPRPELPGQPPAEAVVEPTPTPGAPPEQQPSAPSEPPSDTTSDESE